MRFSYELVGDGWAKCSLRIGEKGATLTASYLSDALADLASAVAAALRGSLRSTFSFTEEPGEYRWILERRPKGRTRIRILEFPQLWGHRPDEEGTVLFDGQPPTLVFPVQAVIIDIHQSHDS